MGPLRPSRLVERIRLTPAPLAALLGAAAVLSLAWTCTTAPLTGFDEADHVAYTARLASSGEPPAVTSGDRGYSTVEEHAYRSLGFLAAVGNVEARPPWHKVQEDAFRRFEYAAGSQGQRNGEGPNPLAKNPPLFYAYEAAVAHRPGRAFFTDLWAMRLANVLVLLAAVCFAWLLAAELFVRMLPRVVAAGVVALQPVLGQLAGIVNSDALLTATYLALTWLGVRACRRGLTIGRLAAIGAAAGACRADARAWHRRDPRLRADRARAGPAPPAESQGRAAPGAGRRPDARGGRRGLPRVHRLERQQRRRRALRRRGELHAEGRQPTRVPQLRVAVLLPGAGDDDAADRPRTTAFTRSTCRRCSGASGPTRSTRDGRPGRDPALARGRRAGACRRAGAPRGAGQAPLGGDRGRRRTRRCLVALLHLASYRSVLGGPDPLITGRYFLPLLG